MASASPGVDALTSGPVAGSAAPGPHVGFSAVDATPDPAAFARHLDAANQTAFVRRPKRRLVSALALGPGDHVLDVGCGTGDDARLLAALVGASGRAVGLDASVAMIDEARRRSSGAAAAPEFVVAAATDLPWPAGTFDACRVERVLHHLAEPAAAVAELARVLRPGGRLAVFEPDFELTVIHGGDPAAARAFVTALTSGVRSGTVGRSVPALFVQAGFRHVRIVPETVLVRDLPTFARFLFLRQTLNRLLASKELTEGAASAWLADLEAADRRGRFLMAMTWFLVSGRIPN